MLTIGSNLNDAVLAATNQSIEASQNGLVTIMKLSLNTMSSKFDLLEFNMQLPEINQISLKTLEGAARTTGDPKDEMHLWLKNLTFGHLYQD